VFKEAIDVIEEWLGFLFKEVFSPIEQAIVFLLLVSSYFSILVLEDLLRWVPFYKSLLLERCKTFFTFY
jgi:hypothetical protein